VHEILLEPEVNYVYPLVFSRSVSIRLPSNRSSSLSGFSSFGKRVSIPRRRRRLFIKLGGDEEEESEEVERALHLDGTIPGTSDEFVRQVSSRAYEMRRKLEQTFDSTSYD
ncbi:hypothetical protein CARUB_v10015675mg, partial [Capsella rubella]